MGARTWLPALVFFVALLWSVTPWASSATALAAGLVFGLLFIHPFRHRARIWSKLLLQICVVALGFGMSLREIFRVGLSGFAYSALGIPFSILVGLLLGRLLKVDRTNSFLVSVGTAICGGSAIAAVGKVIDANDDQMSVSLGTIFLLNAVGLMVFPSLGAAFGLTQTQFGLWAALAIHDTSSVVGAGAKYGATALAVATAVKLARALWIVPLSLVTALAKRGKTMVEFPWFIGCFVLAVICSSYVPLSPSLYSVAANAGKSGLKATLFLIGSNISPETLKTVGVRALLFGVLIWIAVAVMSLWLIMRGVIVL